MPATTTSHAASPSPAAPPAASRGWAWLLFSSLFEITFALSTEATDGFTRLGPSLLTAAAAAAGIYTLSQALKTIDVGVGYTVWSGIGAVGTVVLGTVVYGESLTVGKVLAFVLVIGGALGLRISDTLADRKAADAAGAPVARPAA
ncbi:multidrug efflux SMR transporter [Streptomyces sp. BR123]|uniref:DMT family transporter n=1 Tax=Streptomyces sp. BR123 TaxID=2749828 RepID=UPI0015C41483|nr:multidrug efflux SMR transporter [Streptomyces sp. BR123]NXY95073.1 multidrug efflux SMR transporter [Streptomyces sp. BR123]